MTEPPPSHVTSEELQALAPAPASLLAAPGSSTCSGPQDFAPFGSATSVPTDIAITVDRDPAFDCDNPVPVSLVTPHLAPGFDPDDIRGPIDTGAGVSCTNLKFALHKYRDFTKSRRSPVSVRGAFGSKAAFSSVLPEGKAFLQIPALNRKGFVFVRAFYSPFLSSTLVNEQDFLGHSKLSRNQFSGLSLT